MPTTVNGIGTHYYGMRNSDQRHGVCRSCNREGTLKSYDTRLWFVVIFIPVIPLGRKRIIDECAFCRRHYVANADQYQMARQLTISGALDKYRTHPSPENALEAHAVLLGFHDHDQARVFRTEALEEFPHDSALRARFAMHLDQVSQYQEATALYHQVHDADPEQPDARIGIARRCIGAGELDEARALLAFLEQPGAAQLYPVDALDQLAAAYQTHGRHQDAIDIWRLLLGEFPDAAHNHAVRRMILKSERALGVPDSLLPPRRSSWLGRLNPWNTDYSSGQHWAAIGGVVGVLAVAGALLNNEFTRQRRTIHLLNAFDVPAAIQFDGGPPQSVIGQGQMTLAEGRHHVKVTGPLEEEFDIDVGSGYFERWFRRPAWVVNVGGAGVLRQWTLFYAEHPQPSTNRLLAGQNVVHLPHVDYLFETAPDHISVDKKQQIMKTQLELANDPPSQMLQQIEQENPAGAAQIGERLLRRFPEDEMLLRQYTELAENAGNRHAEEVLKAGLSKRPVSVPWHRAYQTLLQRSGREAVLREEYAAALKADPENARLMYLVGRVESDRARAQELFKASAAADPKLGWPWFALGYDAMSVGDWPNAWEFASKARACRMDPSATAIVWHFSGLGTGAAQTLELEYRPKLAGRPVDLQSAMLLCDVLAATGKAEDTRDVQRQIEGFLMPQGADPTVQRVLASIRRTVDYLRGDLTALKVPPPDPSAIDAIYGHMLLAAGRPEEAAASPALKEHWKDGWQALALSIAFSLAGRDAEATVWRNAACDKLAQGDHDDVQSASALRAEQAPDFVEVSTLVHAPGEKALLLVALAIRFPELRQPCHELASKLTVSRMPPYLLVNRALSSANP